MSKKAINFDLKIERLKEVYPDENYNNAYRDIGRFLHKHGFEHRQGSGYVSEGNCEYNDVVVLSIALAKELGWFSYSVEKMDVTEVGQTWDLIPYLPTDDEQQIPNKDMVEQEVGYYSSFDEDEFSDVFKWEELYPVGPSVLCKELNAVGTVNDINTDGLYLEMQDYSIVVVNPNVDDIEVVEQEKIHRGIHL